MISPRTVTELSADVREARYLVEIDFPITGPTLLTTGDPSLLDVRFGTPIHGQMSVEEVSSEAAQLLFGLSDSSFTPDFMSSSIKRKRLCVWSYYERGPGATILDIDLMDEFIGEVDTVEGDQKVALVTALAPEFVVPSTRVNSTGGYNWSTPPGVYTINGITFEVEKAAVI